MCECRPAGLKYKLSQKIVIIDTPMYATNNSSTFKFSIYTPKSQAILTQITSLNGSYIRSSVQTDLGVRTASNLSRLSAGGVPLVSSTDLLDVGNLGSLDCNGV